MAKTVTIRLSGDLDQRTAANVAAQVEKQHPDAELVPDELSQSAGLVATPDIVHLAGAIAACISALLQIRKWVSGRGRQQSPDVRIMVRHELDSARAVGYELIDVSGEVNEFASGRSELTVEMKDVPGCRKLRVRWQAGDRVLVERKPPNREPIRGGDHR